MIAVRSLAANALVLTGAAVSAVSPAHAATLGEITVESALGQPLSARIPVDIAAGEFIGAACVSAPGVGPTGLGGVPGPVLSVPETGVPGTYNLRVTTTQPLYEPMYELRLQVRCTGTALLVRQYVLMLDLPGTAVVPPPAAATSPATSAPVPATASTATPAPAAPVAARPARPRKPVVLGAPIAPGSNYRVAAGDTLSTIAARISDRGGRGIWQTADVLFATNPDAFIGANQDLIKLGSEIAIPAVGSTPAAAPLVAEAPSPPASTATGLPPAAMPAERAESAAEATAGQAPSSTPPAPAEFASVIPAVSSGAAPDETALAATPMPIFQDEQPVPVATTEPVPEAIDATSPGANPGSGAPPWLAALVGLLIGAGTSLVLLRERLLDACRGLLSLRRPVAAQVASASVEYAPTPPPQIGRPVPPRESSMVVVEERHDDGVDEAATAQTDRTPAITLAARSAAADTGLDNDLSSLFGDASDLQSLEDQNAGLAPSADELDLDLSAATPDVTVDQDISWLGDETALTPTQGSGTIGGSRGDTAEHVDLQTLAAQAADDAKLSQTLKDALNLLESDYEDELTASQVIDKTKLKEVLDASGQEDALVRTGTDRMPRR